MKFKVKIGMGKVMGAGSGYCRGGRGDGLGVSESANAWDK
jgi:hypothetical protein